MATNPSGNPQEKDGPSGLAAGQHGGRGRLKGEPLHLLVTAGPTREKIDEVRDWGNIFTGKTGLDVALAFLELGNVTLLTSNQEHAREFDGYSGKAGMLGAEVFGTHAELKELLAERMSGGGADVVAMTAAVADYRPTKTYRIVSRRSESAGDSGNAKRLPPETRNEKQEVWVVEDVSAGKVKSAYEEIAVVGERTEKLVDLFRGVWGFGGVLIKFKLEVGLSDEELIAVAGKSRVASGADLMVANTLAMARSVGGGEGGAYLIDERGAGRVAREELAGRIAGWVKGRVVG
jgi:phosphopantothenate---cysteine ligase (CTP)